jgi:hypothetical protein
MHRSVARHLGSEVQPLPHQPAHPRQLPLLDDAWKVGGAVILRVWRAPRRGQRVGASPYCSSWLASRPGQRVAPMWRRRRSTCVPRRRARPTTLRPALEPAPDSRRNPSRSAGPPPSQRHDGCPATPLRGGRSVRRDGVRSASRHRDRIGPASRPRAPTVPDPRLHFLRERRTQTAVEPGSSMKAEEG